MRRSDPLNLAMVACVFLFPLALAPARLLHPEPWLGFVAACVTLLTQPELDPKETTDRAATDRLSALAIFVGMLGSQFVAVLDFGYGRGPAPSLLSPIVVTGLALMVGGLAFRIWAIRTLGRWFTSNVRVQEGQVVVDVGPYRLLRHPSYTGALTAALGTTLVFNSRWGALGILLLAIPAYLHRMGTEEQTLATRLGEPYRAYMKHTKRLVPWVY